MASSSSFLRIPNVYSQCHPPPNHGRRTRASIRCSSSPFVVMDSAKIKVAGVGGGGNNAVNRMIGSGLQIENKGNEEHYKCKKARRAFVAKDCLRNGLTLTRMSLIIVPMREIMIVIMMMKIGSMNCAIRRGESENQAKSNGKIYCLSIAYDVNCSESFLAKLRRRNSETLRAQYINTKELRVCVGTWNAGGKLPGDILDIKKWLDMQEPADIYVLGKSGMIAL